MGRLDTEVVGTKSSWVDTSKALGAKANRDVAAFDAQEQATLEQLRAEVAKE